MNELALKITLPKQRGEWVEMRFMARAVEHGLCVSKPWGDSALYDFAVEVRGRFLRVQVKSTAKRKTTGYRCFVRGYGGPYAPGSFEFLAIYLVPEDIWYIIPAAKIAASGSILLAPERKTSKYESFREAWQLLTGRETDDQTAPQPMTGCHESVQ